VLVWWVGARLAEERERACDVDVLQYGNAPKTYAGAILKVCERYLSSRLECAAGVTGSDLKTRIEMIMRNRPGLQLSIARKMVLVLAAGALITVPILLATPFSQTPSPIISAKP
jgi:beta-lactamase regulating signal transducer with metallopeptidase domain